MASDNERLVSSLVDDEAVLSESTTSIQSENMNEKPKNHRIWNRITIEPAAFLLFFAWNLSGNVLQNQILYQTCRDVFMFTESDCALLGTKNGTNYTQEIETKIEPYVANIMMAKSLVESIVPTIVTLFLGPWSDRNGRKPVIILAFAGYIIIYFFNSFLYFLSTFIPVNPWFYLIGYIPANIFGGMCALILSLMCYITDVTKESMRAARFAYMEASLFLGLLGGTLLSSYLLTWTNVGFVLIVSGSIILLAIIYVAIYVEESIDVPEDTTNAQKIKEIFNIDHVKHILITYFEKREGYDRIIIWLLTLILTLMVLALQGNSTIFYLFVREKFHWTIQEYSFYEAISITLQILGNIAGVYILIKLLGVNGKLLMTVAYFSVVIDYMIKGFATHPWQLYMATGVSILRGIGAPMCRSMLAGIVPSGDVGKLFAIVTALESITPLGAAPLYVTVYKAMLPINPGAFNFISAGFYAFCCILLIITFILLKRNTISSYRPISS